MKSSVGRSLFLMKSGDNTSDTSAFIGSKLLFTIVSIDRFPTSPFTFGVRGHTTVFALTVALPACLPSPTVTQSHTQQRSSTSQTKMNTHTHTHNNHQQRAEDKAQQPRVADEYLYLPNLSISEGKQGTTTNNNHGADEYLYLTNLSLSLSQN